MMEFRHPTEAKFPHFSFARESDNFTDSNPSQFFSHAMQSLPGEIAAESSSSGDRSMPEEDDHLNLRKSLLLEKLESELSRRLFSVTTLDLLEELDGIELARGSEASDALKWAYCLVAVDFTLRPMKHGGGGDDAGKFELFKTVKRVWRERFREGMRLGSELLWAWKEEIEAAAWDDKICQSVLNKFEGFIAEQEVRVYLREARDEKGLQKFMGIEGIDRLAEEETPSCHVDLVEEMHKGGEMQEKDQELGENSNVDVDVQCSGDYANNVAKPSVMERNDTANVYESDDSIDGSPDDIACIHFPSRKRIKTSPLKSCETNNVKKKKRRKIRRWSLEEEDTLRMGVNQFGKGCWKLILDTYRDIFEGRTQVDLKDKWRNMTRY